MSKLIWSAIASASIQLVSVNSIYLKSVPDKISIQVTLPIKQKSWREKFEEKRREAEFLDDGIEELISRHKTWLILMSIIFVWMIYKSLWSSR
ncbi:MAG: hypothetical protein AB4206_06845 [Xenococcaceae cyanobacterium]